MTLCDRVGGAGARLTTLGRRTAAGIASGHPLRGFLNSLPGSFADPKIREKKDWVFQAGLVLHLVRGTHSWVTSHTV